MSFRRIRQAENLKSHRVGGFLFAATPSGVRPIAAHQCEFGRTKTPHNGPLIASVGNDCTNHGEHDRRVDFIGKTKGADLVKIAD
jgi:hypothetical protein